MNAASSTFNLGGNDYSEHPNRGQFRRRAHRKQQHVQRKQSRVGERQCCRPLLTSPTMPLQPTCFRAYVWTFRCWQTIVNFLVAIEIFGGSLSSGQSLSLNLIGTASTANLVYVFTGGFTVATGATLIVSPHVNVEINANQAITDDGSANVTGSSTTIRVRGRLRDHNTNRRQWNHECRQRSVVQPGRQRLLEHPKSWSTPAANSPPAAARST